MQTFYVQWGNFISRSLNVSNGIRQGGILSAILFNVYLNDLTEQLKGCNIGCTMNSCMINHLFYADDSVLLAPSPKALQKLINICQEFTDTYDLTYNVKKSMVMCIKPRNMKTGF